MFNTKVHLCFEYHHHHNSCVPINGNHLLCPTNPISEAKIVPSLYQSYLLFIIPSEIHHAKVVQTEPFPSMLKHLLLTTYYYPTIV